jgi:queuine tRNA-ribosyltransferase
MLKIEEQGVTFRSYLDGSIHHLTPESAVEIQRKLGPDIMLMFDESTPFNVTRDYTAKSMQRTHRWGVRSMEEFARTHTGKQAIYGITQGGVYEDLRKESAEWLNSQPFFGQAVGGCYGANKEEFYRVINFARAPLRNDRPTHLLGVGEVEDIWELVSCGFDTFDCVSPTRMARHGTALSRESAKFKLNLFNARFRHDSRPLDETLDNEISQTYSRAYVHHLLKAGEMLGMQILVLHNVAFMNNMLKVIREAIRDDRYLEVKKEWLSVSQQIEAA